MSEEFEALQAKADAREEIKLQILHLWDVGCLREGQIRAVIDEALHEALKIVDK